MVAAWAAAWPLAQVTLRSWPPLLVVAVRCVLGGLALTALDAARGLRLSGALVRVAVIGGSLNVLGFTVASTYAVRYLSAGTASLLSYLQPLLLVLFVAALGHERLVARQLGALVLGLAGVALVTVGTGSGRLSTAGIAIAVGGALSWAAGAAYLRWEIRRPSPTPPTVITESTGLQLLFAGFVVVVLSALFEPWSRVGFGTTSLAAMAALTAANATGWFLYVRLLNGEVDPSRLGAWSFCVPLGANIAGIVFLHERVTPTLLAGGALIIFAIALVERAGRHRRPASSAPAG